MKTHLDELLMASVGAYYDGDDLRCMGCGLLNECCQCEEISIDPEKLEEIELRHFFDKEIGGKP